MAEMVRLFMQKQQVANSSCLTYVIPDTQTLPVLQSGKNIEISLEWARQAQTDAPTIGVILAREGDNYSIDEPYVEAVLMTGAKIKFIHYDNVSEQLDGVDGFLLIGGSFPSPESWYIGSTEAFTTNDLPKRTTAYMTIIDYALLHKIPIFGVCGGMQMLAGMCGAKMFKIDTQPLMAEILHSGINANNYAHSIKIHPDSILYELADSEFVEVNSAHSEAITAVPPDKIKISAKAPDGIIEAIELLDPEIYALGVQWHPERMAIKNEKFSQNLYQRLCDEAKKYQQSKR